MIDLPDARGRYGDCGGACAPEALMTAHEELERAYVEARADPSFQAELAALLRDFAGRPTPLYLAANLTRELGGAKIYLKREDLAHTGAHKINNAIGQGLLAKRLGQRGSVAGPHPYPMIVRDFQSVIGREARAQLLEREGRLPDYAVACVGGGSNAIGLFKHL